MTQIDVKKSGSLFDLPKFSSWFRRWRDAENLNVTHLAERVNLQRSFFVMLSRGETDRGMPARGYDPSISSMYRLAVALDLDLDYLLEKGGMPSVGSRWSAFTAAERAALQLAVTSAGNNPFIPESVKSTLQRLSVELLPTQEETL